MPAPQSRHVIVINRYGPSLAPYTTYLDHEQHAVTYISVASAVADTPPEAAEMVSVETSGELVNGAQDSAAILAAAHGLVERHGVPIGVVALHEGDLDVAAEIRERFGVPGDRAADLAPFRDKLEMYHRAHAAGVAAPETVLVDSPDTVLAFAERRGWPLIVKPRTGTGSTAVRRLEGPADAAALQAGDDLVVQPFVEAPILHVDGVFDGQDLMVAKVSRYVGTCMAYETGSPLGSYELDDPLVVKTATEMVEGLLSVLSPHPAVFHAELFDRGDEGLSLVEVAGRAGGAEVPAMWREVHGVDLLRVALDLQLGRPPLLDVDGPPSEGDAVGGWLLVPPTVERPCVVQDARVEGEARPTTTFAQLPEPGTVIQAGGGYSHAARFRFGGAASADLEADIRALVESVRLECATLSEDVLVLIGSGGQAYREYAMPGIAASARVVLFDRHPPSWQRAYCDTTHYLDPGRDLVPAVRDHLAAHRPGARVGVMTWDESVVHDTALLAEELGAPGITVDGVANCRDKLRTRMMLADDEALAVRFRLADDLEGAMAAGKELGYPLVLKPRSLAGSAGVMRVALPEDMAGAYATVADSEFPGLVNEPGVLVEEFLSGPEMSVDCLVVDGVATAVNVARKQVGFNPSFEEVGHVVRAWRHEPWADTVQDLMRRTHELLRVGSGVTHAEVRLTPDGPRLVELNCRLGGDFIPLLAQLATGVDLVACAGDIALRRPPRDRPTMDRVAQVAFLYPPEDCTVEEVDLSGSAAVEGIHAAIALTSTGDELVLPPRGAVGRYAALVAVGDSVDETSRAIADATGLARLRWAPL